MMRFVVCTYLWCQLTMLTRGTNDLNHQELMNLADHLTTEECRLLYAALTQESHVILMHEIKPEQVPNKPCLELLTDWDEGQGKDKNSIDVIIRLNQIGKKDLADTFSTMVAQEKVDQVRQHFLNDPFKSMINENSPLLDEAPKAAPTGWTRADQDDKWTSKETFALLATGFSILLILTITMRTFGLPCAFCCGRQEEGKKAERGNLLGDMDDGADSTRSEEFELESVGVGGISQAENKCALDQEECTSV